MLDLSLVFVDRYFFNILAQVFYRILHEEFIIVFLEHLQLSNQFIYIRRRKTLFILEDE